jgi:hypothetical protein
MEKAGPTSFSYQTTNDQKPEASKAAVTFLLQEAI